MKKKLIVLWCLIILGFAAIEFPGILFINRIEPRIFGLPFIYGFTLIIWFLLCILMYVGYRMKWGFQKQDYDKEKHGGGDATRNFPKF